MAIEILKATATLDDAEGIDRFLASVPKGEGLRAKLRPGNREQLEHYDQETRTARYLTIDGVALVCFVVEDIPLDAARLIARQCRGIAEWSTAEFHRAVERALSVTIRSTE